MIEIISSPRAQIIAALVILLALSGVLAWLTVTEKPKKTPPSSPYHEKERRLLTKLEKARRAHKRIKEIERQLHDHRFGGQR